MMRDSQFYYCVYTTFSVQYQPVIIISRKFARLPTATQYHGLMANHNKNQTTHVLPSVAVHVQMYTGGVTAMGNTNYKDYSQLNS